MLDEVLDLLLSMPELTGWSLTVIDIATDAALVEQYGDRLPVIRVDDAEFEAPFVLEQLAKWLGDVE